MDGIQEGRKAARRRARTHTAGPLDILRRGGRGTPVQAQKRWLPMTLMRGRDQIQPLVAVLGLK